jgi:hypothetical protein
VLLGNGDGTFAPQVTYPVGSLPESVAVGDFTGDGHLDLAVANDGDNTVSVLLGRGDGTFAPQGTYPVGAFPYSVAVGDFNGDGHLDLAVANGVDNTVSVLLGRGDGTFSSNTVQVSGQNFSATAGTPFSGPVATVIGAQQASDLAATIDWGDGSATSAGTVSGTDPYSISGSHTYTMGGSYSVTITVTDSNLNSTSTGTATATVTVNDSDLGLTNMPGNITTNATSPQGAVVTYTSPTVVDEDNPLPPVNCSPASGSTFAIGNTTVTCSVSDSDDSNSPVSQSFSVTVQPVLSVSVNNLTATEGRAFSGVVATGTAYGSSNPLSATISWGDGNSSTVSITPNPDGSYSVSGSHTYAEEGSYALSVSVKDRGSLSTSGNGTATVSDAALTLTHFLAGGTRDRYAALAATFTDADPNGQISDYTATINWGDGNTTTVKVYKNPFGKGFVLAGLHQYTGEGTYSVTLTVSDAGGSQVSKKVSVTVK